MSFFFVLPTEMEAAAGFLLPLTLMALRVNTVHTGKAIYISHFKLCFCVLVIVNQLGGDLLSLAVKQ